jgi:hypothetical protein
MGLFADTNVQHPTAAPIYLLFDGEARGPFEYAEVIAQLEEGEVEPESLACIERMREWRSVPEACVWAAGKLLAPIREQALELVHRLADCKLDLRYARVELKTALQRHNILVDTDTTERLGIILDANAALLRNHRLCSAGQDHWNKAATEFYPALELTPFGEITFPRDWKAAWQAAGGQVFDGRMVALKGAAVWEALSDFGFPFPPFSLDTSMWIEDVPFEEAQDFGLLTKPQEIALRRDLRAFDLVGLL